MLKQTESGEPKRQPKTVRRDFLHLMMVILGVVLWLALLLLTYYTLLTLPLIVIVTILLYLLTTRRSDKLKNHGWQSRESDLDETHDRLDESK